MFAEIFEKFPAIYERLSAGESEAISHGMNTIRRIIKALADRVYPAKDKPVDVNGQKYEVGSDKVLNRIDLFVLEHVKSKSRIARLKHTLHDLYERASFGSHSDIDVKEARSLFLGTYIVVGEILEMVEPVI